MLIAVDHGTKTGYSVFDNAKLKHYGAKQFESITCLKEVHDWFSSLVKVYKPTVIVLEKINVAGSKFGGNNVIKLSQFQGVLRLVAQSIGAEVVEMNPTSMKKVITGYGKAEKVEVAQKVANIWNLNRNEICVPVYYKKKDGIKTYEADVSDSIALGTFYYMNRGEI